MSATHVRPLRQRQTSRAVFALLLVLIGVCAGWAVLVQHAVKPACDRATPPPRAQYLHCGERR
ncbi:MAG TPA: hypothetical protein VHX15_20645 [Frankiaceae bacterium]|jgi:hypothetical protein|nr:hypothetical protein [Frankiaceae bacterium]